MARTAYQKQADSRTRTALRLRSRADGKVRKYAAALVAALVSAADAKACLDRVNLLYGVDISPETLLVHDVRTAGLGTQLSNLLAASSPGEEVQLFNPTANGNSGLVLDNELVFGETVLALPSVPVDPVESAPTPGIRVTTLQALRINDSTWNIVVQASSPSGTYHLANDASPYAYNFENEHEMAFSLDGMTAGQAVQFTFTDSVNNQVTLQRTLTLLTM
ncbi:hypothetical protein [Hymenobacter profundi]|uniref:Uncharacterized protein n=1 Tax=Hymenobacter profundi TaxID=1982110 RepID=A0ABS6WW26_9BACT|nr:hypothetical protein [Hymenobacter profundi]MBW3127271.1 hypothetical protein [Hymenobacter profundi]